MHKLTNTAGIGETENAMFRKHFIADLLSHSGRRRHCVYWSFVRPSIRSFTWRVFSGWIWVKYCQGLACCMCNAHITLTLYNRNLMHAARHTALRTVSYREECNVIAGTLAGSRSLHVSQSVSESEQFCVHGVRITETAQRRWTRYVTVRTPTSDRVETCLPSDRPETHSSQTAGVLMSRDLL